jgi:arylsulfatase A
VDIRAIRQTQSGNLTSRGAFLKGAVLLCVLAIISVANAHAQTRPNILFILLDNVGYEQIGVYGSQTYSTPNINRLAREGTRFTNMIALPMCIPTRLVLDSGRYLHRATSTPTSSLLANVVGNGGYRTLFAGKRHIEGRWSHSAAGFDLFLSLRRNSEPRYFGPILNDNGTTRQFASNVFGPDVIRERVIDYLEENRTGRFFIAWHVFFNHQPSVRVPGAPETGSRAQRHREMMARADSDIGIVLARLSSLGLVNNTMVMFLTDGGSEPRGGLVPVSTPQGTIQVRGGFGLPTDAGTRVPFIGRWPGNVPAGRVDTTAMDISSILPTLAAIAGAGVPAGVQGENLLPQLLGGSGGRNWAYQWYDPDPVQGSNFGNEASEFVRGPRYKLYRTHRCLRDFRFFDTQTDPNEEDPISRAETTAAQRAEWDRLNAVFAQTKPGAPVRPVSCS